MADVPVTDAVLSPLARRVEPRVLGGELGPYRVDRLLGRGGMGDVYLGHDPRLDRPVAIKVLSHDAWGEPDEQRRQLLVREALALAKLSHPNILTVFEIGAAAGELFLATEYVEGGTLRAWLAAEPRTPRAILDVFLQAGRGLAAAHGAGLVHRDFKPDNVLIDRAGRARVADFGLVTGGAEQGDAEAALGTPAYMPPEQHDGRPADARSDQYAFCVSLFEALYGQRPFHGSTIDDLRRAKDSVPPPPPGRRLPAHLRAAIARGLLPEPRDRHPSMDELLAILAHDPEARRRRVLVVAGTALAAGAAVFLTLRATAPPEPSCRGAEERLAGVWDAATRERVRAAFVASGRPFAADSFVHVADKLDRYAASWAAMHHEACAATALRHEQSAAVLDLRMACLDTARRELEALTALLGRASSSATIFRAFGAVDALPAVETCGDVAALSQAMPPPADHGLRLALSALRSRVAGVDAAINLGPVRDWLPVVQGIVAEARVLGDAAVLGDALLSLAFVQHDVDRQQVIPTLQAAQLEAARTRNDRLAAKLLSEEVFFLSAGLGRFADAALLVPTAMAAVTRAGNPPVQRAELLQNAAIIDGNLGDNKKALERTETALAIVAGLPDREFIVASLHNDYAIWLRKVGRLPEAARSAERALGLYEKYLGKDNPQCCIVLSNLGNIAVDAGDYRRAEEVLRRALAIAETAYGPEHQQVGRILNNLGNVLSQLGEYDGALAFVQRAAALQERVLGPDHVELATTFNVLADLQLTLGDLAASRRAAERARAIQEKAGDSRLGWSLLDLARLDRLEGRLAEARAEATRARDGFVKARGAESPAVATCVLDLAQIELAAGRLDEAAGLAARAVELRGMPGRNGRDHADAIDIAADILDAQGKHEAALERHREALAVMEKSVQPTDYELATPLTGIGTSLLALGRAAEAAAPLERAAALRGERGGGPAAVARTRAALARARRL